MSFEQVIGHQAAIRILQGSLKEKRLGLAYLFHGPAGLGKSFVAKQYAKSLNCRLQDEDCCDSCPSCLRAEKLSYPDLHWLDLEGASNNIKIEQIRMMQESISLRPFEGNAKAFIINNCQNLTEEAANCLLKVTEEPPADSVIILITSDVRLVLPTIASRCQKVKFSLISRGLIEDVLKKRHSLDGLQSRYLAYCSGGRIADALALHNSGFLSDRDSILAKFSGSLPQGRPEDLFKDKAQGRKALSVLFNWHRDILFVKVGANSDCLINQDKAFELIRQAKHYSYPQLISLLEALSRSFEYLNQNINARILADNLILTMQKWKN